MRKKFGDAWYMDVDWPVWGIVWRKQIKELFFDQDILISEMITGMDEACEKGKWPIGKIFFHRLQDVCLKNRREHQPIIQVDRGMESIKNLIKK